MKVNSIKLVNFRNYKNLELSFDGSRNIILGENGQGKTNILEAIYMCAFARSFRTNKAQEMVMIGESNAQINVNAESEDIEKNIKIYIDSSGKKEIKKDGKTVKRTAELLKNLVVVVFSPEDLKLVKDDPEKRRIFLNKEISQISPKYYENLINYNKLVKNKRVILMDWDRNSNEAMLDILDMQLAKYGSEIIKYRKKFIELISEKSKEIHFDISSQKEVLTVKYRASISTDDENEYYDMLKTERWKDIRDRRVLRGPHRDDLEFFINDRNVRKYGSQGQQRTVALSLKLAEVDITAGMIGENPILILDDVLSELDISRQRYLINEIKNVQLFVSATEINDEIKEKINTGKTIYIKEGEILK